MSSCIVLIDDNTEILASLGFTLSNAGYEVHTAADAQLGLQLVRRYRPRVIITDIYMPHMSGFELAEAVRADGLIADAFIILITAMAADEQELADFGECADMCIAKPVEDDVLLPAVAKILDAADNEPLGLLKYVR